MKVVNMPMEHDKRLKIMDSEPGPIEVSLVELDRKTKAKLYPRVRNKFNVNKPIYESEGTVYVNPNTFYQSEKGS